MNSNNPIFNMFGGFTNFMGQFKTFRQNFDQSRLNPQDQAYQQAQQLMDSNKMSQDQYNQILNIAGTIRQLFG